MYSQFMMHGQKNIKSRGSSLLQPIRALFYLCSPAHWHGTISKTIACLTSQKPSNET